MARAFLIIVITLISFGAVYAQDAVVISDSAEVKAAPDPDSRTVKIYVRGMTFQTTGTSSNNWIGITGGGFIHRENIREIRIADRQIPLLQQSHSLYAQDLMTREPSSLSSEELQFLMMYASLQQDDIDKNINTMKILMGIHTGITVAMLIASSIVLITL